MPTHVFMMRARATISSSGYVEGHIHGVTVFVAVGDRPSAESIAMAALRERGWDQEGVVRHREMPDDVIPDDKVMRAAFVAAVSQRCAVVVYSDRIEQE